MNHHPLHTNIGYAEKSQYSKILIECTLVFNMVVKNTVHDPDDLEKNLIAAKKLGFKRMVGSNPKEYPLAHKCTCTDSNNLK